MFSFEQSIDISYPSTSHLRFMNICDLIKVCMRNVAFRVQNSDTISKSLSKSPLYILVHCREADPAFGISIWQHLHTSEVDKAEHLRPANFVSAKRELFATNAPLGEIFGEALARSAKQSTATNQDGIPF